jgi:flavin-dependent dehydrogenase
MRPAELLERFREARAPGSRVVRTLVGGVPSVKDPHRIGEAPVFPAGDATGAADPTTGAGIAPAMESAAGAGRSAAGLALGGTMEEARREYLASARKYFGDRGRRCLVRDVMTRASDKELAKIISLTGQYFEERTVSRSDPFGLVKFLVRNMPGTFGLLRHLLRL